jgi:hypothetical protein
MTVLSDPVYRGFGPTSAAEYLHKPHQITVSKETMRQWMAKAEPWQAGRRRVVEIHEWRPLGEHWCSGTPACMNRPEMPPMQIARRANHRGR